MRLLGRRLYKKLSDHQKVPPKYYLPLIAIGCSNTHKHASLIAPNS
jgi:hypothetical protein